MTFLYQCLGFLLDISRIEFSLNVFTEFADFSDKNNFNKKDYLNLHLLCKRPGCYYIASKSHVTERIFKLTPIQASGIYQFPWVHWISVPFRENSNDLFQVMCIKKFLMKLSRRNTRRVLRGKDCPNKHRPGKIFPPGDRCSQTKDTIFDLSDFSIFLWW